MCQRGDGVQLSENSEVAGPTYDQQVSAFKLENRLIMTSNVKADDGRWYLHRPIVVLDARTPPAEIGLAVIQALSQSRTCLAEPPSSVELDKTMGQILKAASAESFDHFLEHALHCSVGRGMTGIEVLPAHNNGFQGDPKGFQLLWERRILLEVDAPPEHLAEALLQGFATCTSAYK